jgi:hypothetical protein
VAGMLQKRSPYRGALGRRATGGPSRRLKRDRRHHRDDRAVSDYHLHCDARDGLPRPDLGADRGRRGRKDIRHTAGRARRAVHL